MLDTLETKFHGQKTFRLAGKLSWSETPYFYIKAEPLRMVPKLPLNEEM